MATLAKAKEKIVLWILARVKGKMVKASLVMAKARAKSRKPTSQQAKRNRQCLTISAKVKETGKWDFHRNRKPFRKLFLQKVRHKVYQQSIQQVYQKLLLQKHLRVKKKDLALRK